MHRYGRGEGAGGKTRLKNAAARVIRAAKSGGTHSTQSSPQAQSLQAQSSGATGRLQPTVSGGFEEDDSLQRRGSGRSEQSQATAFSLAEGGGSPKNPFLTASAPSPRRSSLHSEGEEMVPWNALEETMPRSSSSMSMASNATATTAVIPVPEAMEASRASRISVVVDTEDVPALLSSDADILKPVTLTVRPNSLDSSSDDRSESGSDEEESSDEEDEEAEEQDAAHRLELIEETEEMLSPRTHRKVQIDEIDKITDAVHRGLLLVESDKEGNTLVASVDLILKSLGLREDDIDLLLPEKRMKAKHPTVSRDALIERIEEMAFALFLNAKNSAAASGSASPDPDQEILQQRKMRLLKMVGKIRSLESHHKHESKEKVQVARSVLDVRLKEVIGAKRKHEADAPWRRVWDTVHLLTICFILVATSATEVFLREIDPVWFFILQWPIRLFWGLDIIVSLRMPVFDHSNYMLVTGPREVAKRKWMMLAIDVLAALPIDLILWIALFQQDCCEDPSVFHLFSGWTGVLGAYKFFRKLLWFKIARLVYLYEFVSIDNITPSHVDFFFARRNLLVGLSISLLVGHAFTVWYASTHEERGTMYLHSLTDLLSMLTGTGPGVDIGKDPHAQTLAIILIVLAVLLQGLIIGRMSVIIFRSDVKSTNIQKMRETLSILTHYKVPQETMREILSYQQHALNEDADKYQTVLIALPEAMRREIVIYVRVDAVNRVSLFTDATLECKIHLATTLERCVACPMEDIVSIGDFGDDMFMITFGDADVIIVTGMTVATLSRGDYFGEIALVTEQCTRQATVRALSYCDLWALSRVPFLDSVVRFPKLCDIVTAHMEVKKIDPAYFLAQVKEAREAELVEGEEEAEEEQSPQYNDVKDAFGESSDSDDDIIDKNTLIRLPSSRDPAAAGTPPIPSTVSSIRHQDSVRRLPPRHLPSVHLPLVRSQYTSAVIMEGAPPPFPLRRGSSFGQVSTFDQEISALMEDRRTRDPAHQQLQAHDSFIQLATGRRPSQEGRRSSIEGGRLTSQGDPFRFTPSRGPPLFGGDGRRSPGFGGDGRRSPGASPANVPLNPLSVEEELGLVREENKKLKKELEKKNRALAATAKAMEQIEKDLALVLNLVATGSTINTQVVLSGRATPATGRVTPAATGVSGLGGGLGSNFSLPASFGHELPASMRSPLVPASHQSSTMSSFAVDSPRIPGQGQTQPLVDFTTSTASSPPRPKRSAKLSRQRPPPLGAEEPGDLHILRELPLHHEAAVLRTPVGTNPTDESERNMSVVLSPRDERHMSLNIQLRRGPKQKPDPKPS